MNNYRRIVGSILALAVVLMCAGYAIAQQPPTSVVLKGAPMGGVKFNHKAHTTAGIKCDSCHHASKPEKALKSKFENCQDCHTKTPAEGVKTNAQNAFHNTCLNCHKTDAKAKTANAPTQCAGCHKKENV